MRSSVIRTFAIGFALALLRATSAIAAPTESHLQFDGIDDRVTVADSAALDITGAITLEAWIRPDTISSTKDQNRILSKSSELELMISTGDTGCDAGTSGHVQWRTTIGGSNKRICGGTLSTGTWHHLAATYDGAQVALYVDGVLVASAPRSGAIAANSSALALGNHPVNSRPYDGALDEARVWNRALAIEEIQAQMGVELAGNEAGLVAVYRLNDGAGQVASDGTLLGNHGRLGSSTAPDAGDPEWATSGPPVNQPPTVDAGPDRAIAFPVDWIALDGTVSDDDLPSGPPLTTWTQVDGPAAMAFDDADAIDTIATFFVEGVYVLRLSADDSEYLTSDEVEITVRAEPQLATIVVTPSSASIAPGGEQQFSAAGFDESGDPFPIDPVWTADGGAISASGLYTAGLTPGQFTVTASDGAIIGTAMALVSDTGAPTERYLEFDGVDDRVTVPDAAALDLADALTLEAWIRPDTISSSGDQNRIISKSSESELTIATSASCGFGTSGQVQWRATIGGVNARICGGTVTPRVWHHLAATFDGSQAALYVDGWRVASAARSGAIATNNLALALGNHPTNSRPFDGDLDEVRIWNRALTQSEIQSQMERELTGSEAGLVALYLLNEGSGQVATDRTGLGNHGRLGASADPDADDPQWVSGEPVGAWPTLGWENATPLAMGMDQGKLEQARDYALSAGGAGFITRSGKLVMSWGSATQLYDVKSATKSIGSAALGLAIRDGRMDLSDRAQTHLPSVGVPPESNTSTGWLDDITITHLATHTAGFHKPGGFISLLFEPGTAWAYSDGGVNWIADTLTVVLNEDLNEVLFDRVFTKLGIDPSDLDWRSNINRGDTINGIKRREFGAGISVNVNAMARVGYLFLRRGRWEGQAILPHRFVAAARLPVREIAALPVRNDTESRFAKAPRHFGILWWNNGDGSIPGVPRDAYWAWGFGDHLIVVIPSLDIVASRTGAAFPLSHSPSFYAALAPFITPIAESVNQP